VFSDPLASHILSRCSVTARLGLLPRSERKLVLSSRILAARDSSLVRATSLRLLRLATNSFLSSVELVLRTMGEFAPDPDEVQPTDAELEAILQLRISRAGAEGDRVEGWRWGWWGRGGEVSLAWTLAR
jgi:EKC/KEOPS complex subunit PCC1/LAGE3